MKTCPWLIEIASGNPEPDFPEDCYRIVECGAPVTVDQYGGWQCEAGHFHISLDDPAWPAYDRQAAFNERNERN